MTIAVRSNVFGNEAEAVFTSVEDAVAHLRIHPTFEIVPKTNLRPYGDVEGNAPADISEEEFRQKDETMMSVLTAFFKEMNRSVAFEKASSYAARRWSVHWYATDCYVATQKHAEYFAKELYKQFEFPVGIKGDLNVYHNDQKFRHGNTPTAKGEVRPFVCENYEDVFISHIPPTADLLEFEVPVEIKVGCLTKVEDDELVPLLDCIKVESWTDYTTCMRLVWAMCSCGASSGLVHSYCEKASNYGMKWVNDLIRNHKVEKSPSLSFLRKIARQDNPQRYCAMVFKDTTDPRPYVEEMMRLTEDENTTIDNGRYLMKLGDEDTIAVKCMLGCGKSFEMVRKLRELMNPKLRVLVVSGRRTWSDHIHAELDELGFVHYEKYKQEQFEKKKGKVTQIDADRLILQMSPASMRLISEQSYDFVIADECETILTMMSPLKIFTNTEEWLLMGKTWERLMRETKRVLFMDAFLNDRTMDMLRELRKETHLIINTTQPYNKTCVEYTNKTQFYNAVIGKLKQKKRGVSIWGTVKAGTEFQEFLTAAKIEGVFYHKKSDAKIKARDMSDVNKWWAIPQSVGYTSTITVGINYTNKDAPFDFLSIYATAWGGSARDFAQGLHRAREVKDNHILAHIDPNPKNIVKGEAGMDAQEKLWNAERSLRRDIVASMGEAVEDYGVLPEWWKKVIMRNRNEAVVNAKFFPVLMASYMELCGIKSEVLLGAVEKKKSVGHSSFPSVEEVREIDAEEAEWLHNNRRGLTEEDHYALEKFKMKEKVARVDQEIWEKWNNDNGVIKNAFNVVHRTPTDLFRRQDHKVLDLVDKNVAKIEVVQNCGLDWTKSWVKPISEMPEIDLHAFTLRDRSQKDTPEQHWRNVGKAFERFGLAVSVQQKRVKVKGVCDYAYSVTFNREKSVIDYIHPKLDLAAVFCE